MDSKLENVLNALNKRFVSHPWHGIEIGKQAPNFVNAFIEIIPADSIKYEIDKPSGHIMVDRAQKLSNHLPCLYGFIPQTFCDTKVAEFCMEKTGKIGIGGDQDPLDICVLSERQFGHVGIKLEAKVIGGLRMIDGGEADDKIIAVLKGDQAYGKFEDVNEMPQMVIDRVRHFFLTYKDLDGGAKNVEVTHVYGREEACEVIRRSQDDYTAKYGNANEELAQALVDALK